MLSDLVRNYWDWKSLVIRDSDKRPVTCPFRDKPSVFVRQVILHPMAPFGVYEPLYSHPTFFLRAFGWAMYFFGSLSESVVSFPSMNTLAVEGALTVQAKA
jgi:hypothetical protein